MRFAYADPPYPGQAKRHYSKEVLCAEVDHSDLIARLIGEFPDGWALSSSSTALRDVLALCPPTVRVMAWVKPFAIFKPNVRVAYAWEPVLVSGGRKGTRRQATVRDWVSANVTLRRGLCGVKPDAFCYWLFDVLNMQPSDELIDLYPGSGAVGTAWQTYRNSFLPFIAAVP